MRLRIGPREWTVIPSDTMISLESGPASGSCDYDHQIIRIYRRGAVPDKLATLAHEAYHAWVDAVGEPRGCEEERAKWFGTVVAAFVLDVLGQLHDLEVLLNVPIESLFDADYRRDLAYDRYRSRQLSELEKLLNTDVSRIIERLKARRQRARK